MYSPLDMAPPTLPTEVKKRRGTFRKDRSPGEMIAVDPINADETPAPATLQETGSAEWYHALRTCRWLASSDLSALKIYCEIIDRRAEFAKQLKESGDHLMLETTTGYAYVNPLVVGMRQCEEQLVKWQGLLGLTPSDRSRLGVAEVKAKSTLDKLAEKKAMRTVGAR